MQLRPARKPRFGINDSGLNILINSLLTAVGLFFFSFGVYLGIQAGIGVAPWDTFNLGLVNTFGVKYGTASILVSCAVLAIDLLLRERIGIGMILDAILVGKFVDLFNWLNLVPMQESKLVCLLLLLASLVIKGFSQAMYMKAALSCGPRDTMLVGLARHLKKIPIGVISIFIMATVTLTGWLLGGPIGLGTLLCVLLEGPIMQLDFKLVHFDPTAVKHQDIVTSAKVIFAKKKA